MWYSLANSTFLLISCCIFLFLHHFFLLIVRFLKMWLDTTALIVSQTLGSSEKSQKDRMVWAGSDHQKQFSFNPSLLGGHTFHQTHCWSGRITSPDLLATFPLMEPRVQGAFWAVSMHYQLILNFLSTKWVLFTSAFHTQWAICRIFL